LLFLFGAKYTTLCGKKKLAELCLRAYASLPATQNRPSTMYASLPANQNKPSKVLDGLPEELKQPDCIKCVGGLQGAECSRGHSAPAF
jgi:hypothetical protein